MAINLATKYSDKIQTRFTHESYIAGKVSQEYEFTGVKGIKVYTPTTVPMNDYNRTATGNRYGTPVEMQDTVQDLIMSQDKSFSLTIDKGNNTEQMMIKNAGKMMNLQQKEQIVPMVDRYAFSRYIQMAGTVGGASAKPTKSNIVEMIADGAQALDDNQVPDEGRYIAVTAEMYKMLKLSPEFLGLEKLGEQALGKGVVGEIHGMKVVKVPTSYLPADCYFLIWHKSAVILPYKIKDAKIHEDPPGISGALLEGRNLYDAFVLGAKAYGLYACVLSTKKVATPTASFATNECTLSCTTGSATMYYTVDGTDPRYSSTRLPYTAKFGTTAGQVIKAYAEKADMYASDVMVSTAT